MKQLPAGAIAPDFTLSTPVGRSLNLFDQLTAGPVVLAFYKASCPTCQLAFPFLQQIFAATGGNSAATLWGISQDEPAETWSFVRKFNLGFDILIDPHPFDVSSAYGLEFVPAVFVVGSGRLIQSSDYGFSKGTLADVAQVMTEGTGMAPPQLFRADDGLPARRPG